jgi:divalent metal cation (Fe/Co/Zn/Cd) transporter
VDTRDRLHRRALRLEYGTIAWNGSEAALTVGLGIAAGSLALVGFGSDSLIEIFASLVVVWHLKGEDHPVRQRRALRLISIAFLALAAVLLTAGVRDLVTGRQADESITGIIYLAVAALIMFGLAKAKSRTARAMDSSTLQAEAGVTYLDAVLAAGTMLGLLLNAWLGWWWADPTAALLVAIVAIHEGRETWLEAAPDQTQCD